MTALVGTARLVMGTGLAGMLAFLARLAKVRLRAKSLQEVAHLDEHILCDIGVSDDMRHVFSARREAELALLRTRCQAGPFFVPPA